jgi:hypothetical protein
VNRWARSRSMTVTSDLREPITRLILSAAFLGVALIPFAKICLGC